MIRSRKPNKQSLFSNFHFTFMQELAKFYSAQKQMETLCKNCFFLKK